MWPGEVASWPAYSAASPLLGNAAFGISEVPR